MVTVESKYVGEVKDKFIGENYVKVLEDCNEEYIKGEMKENGC